MDVFEDFEPDERDPNHPPPIFTQPGDCELVVSYSFMGNPIETLVRPFAARR